jgi:haloalkane dehalogenase
MRLLRTPDECFAYIDFDFEPHYSMVKAPDGTDIRVHHIDEGPNDAEVLICLHGEPSWSYLYRKVIPIWVKAGYRVIAFDLVGFGKSDKPADINDLTYQRQVAWTQQWLDGLDIKDINLICHDWGGMIGMRLLATDMARYKRVVAANTLLLDSSHLDDAASAQLKAAHPSIAVPDAETVQRLLASGDPLAVSNWIKYAAENPGFSVRDVFEKIAMLTDSTALHGYVAPFPDTEYLAGPLSFPAQFPVFPHQALERLENARVWQVLGDYTKPFLTVFSDNDPVTRGHEEFFKTRIPGAAGITHTIIQGAGHYLQDERPDEFAQAVLEFLQAT